MHSFPFTVVHINSREHAQRNSHLRENIKAQTHKHEWEMCHNFMKSLA